MGSVASSSAPIRFRPMPLPELLDELFRLYRRYFPVIAGLSVLLVVPGLLTSLLSGSYRSNSVGLLITYINGGSTALLQRIQDLQAQQSPGWGLLGGLIGLIIVPFAAAGIYRAAIDAANGQAITIGSVLRGTLARYWAVWGYLLLLGLIFTGVTIVWVITFIVPLVGFVLVFAWLAVVCWLGVRWAVGLPALLAERLGPVVAMRRSWNLVSGMWWRTFGILLLTGVAYVVISLALFALFGGIAALIPAVSEDVRSAIAAAGTALSDALIAPVFPILLTLLYFDLRVRKEGLDLDQLARETSPGPAPA